MRNAASDGKPAPEPDSRDTTSADSQNLPRGGDRRERPTPMLSRYTLIGQRRVNRRTTDPQSAYYVDRSSGIFSVAILAMLAFIVADTASTLYILGRGGSEANPLMRWLLGHGTDWFVTVKVGSGLLGFVLLAVHCKFPTARWLVFVLVSVYFVLALYHLVLLSNLLL